MAADTALVERRYKWSLFVRGDGLLVFEDVADLVEAFEDAGFRKRIDGEAHRGAAVKRQRLRSEVDRHQQIRFQHCVNLRIHHDGKKSVLQAVLPEDVGEARRDDRFESEILQRPHGMLARTAAAEIIAGNENL